MLSPLKIILLPCFLIITLAMSACASPVQQLVESEPKPVVQTSSKQEQSTSASLESDQKTSPIEENFEPEADESAEGTEVESEVEPEAEPPVPVVKRPLLCVEAGHQGKGNSDKEPIAPGSTVMKAKVSSGTRGIATGKPEHELNLEVALKLKKALQEDYTVIMVRENPEIDMSNKERAQFCSSSGADLMIRLHADGSENSAVHGMSLLYPSADSPYTNKISGESLTAAGFLEAAIVKETGVQSNGLVPRDDLTGFNWLTIPSVLVEMGFMSNRDEDLKLSQDDYQEKMAIGIKKGLDEYYSFKEK